MHYAEIDALVAARDDARSRQEWGEADAIRERLLAAGIIVEDFRTVSHWRAADRRELERLRA